MSSRAEMLSSTAVACSSGSRTARSAPLAGPGPLEVACARVDAQFPDLPADPEARRLQHWLLRDEDLLGPRRGQQSEHHERVGHGLQAEPRDGVRAALPDARQRSRYGPEV